ncbi:hypothetical protein B0H03_101304 [Rathayibacter iranicus NCPPB 2253 = VKM Ac-1602]|uniref:Uncharacterized protein n=1 Tax=Rathayibacter iranicus NCPPB 2253 = VKM Ac-1602 TaxID=1328868 RepID=A0ABX5LM64_9MICO|nr:hypothetical protein B0H03_101304 [Rathayibacter iranicus NCPPB 2253 = VKM Ac-1602]
MPEHYTLGIVALGIVLPRPRSGCSREMPLRYATREAYRKASRGGDLADTWRKHAGFRFLKGFTLSSEV